MTAAVHTLITSGAYVGEEMKAEFGRVPPAFLPVGPAYLIQHQLRRLQGRQSLWLSLPMDFELADERRQLLDGAGVSTLRVDHARSLGLSVFRSLFEIDPDGMFEILHGDTLIIDPPLPAQDCVSVEVASESYRWGLVDTDGDRITGISDEAGRSGLSDETEILSGYFAFSDVRRLLKCLLDQQFDFVRAIDEYAGSVPLTARRDIQTFDFGHQKTFYSSRKQLATARHFNSLTIDEHVVVKKSDNAGKIDAEANWLRSVPAALQPYTVRLIEDHDEPVSGQYKTLYSSSPTLVELYLAETPRLVWNKILDSCADYLTRARRIQSPDREGDFDWLVIGKLKERIGGYPACLPGTADELAFNGRPVGSLSTIVSRLQAVVEAGEAVPASVMHGDLCFSNILFDFRNDRIQLIDPRGVIGDEVTIYGDIRYDIAKLGHSIVGRYDEIVSEHVQTSRQGNSFVMDLPGDDLRDWLEKRFFEMAVAGIRFDSEPVKAAIVSLFLSMIPLHGDVPSRQLALFANGLRLYQRFFG